MRNLWITPQHTNSKEGPQAASPGWSHRAPPYPLAWTGVNRVPCLTTIYYTGRDVPLCEGFFVACESFHLLPCQISYLLSLELPAEHHRGALWKMPGRLHWRFHQGSTSRLPTVPLSLAAPGQVSPGGGWFLLMLIPATHTSFFPIPISTFLFYPKLNTSFETRLGKIQEISPTENHFDSSICPYSIDDDLVSQSPDCIVQSVKSPKCHRWSKSHFSSAFLELAKSQPIIPSDSS